MILLPARMVPVTRNRSVSNGQGLLQETVRVDLESVVFVSEKQDHINQKL